MARVKRGGTPRPRHKKILRLAKGFYGAKSRWYKLANQYVVRALANAYRDRRLRKREFRRLWIARINAAARGPPPPGPAGCASGSPGGCGSPALTPPPAATGSPIAG